jgi:hypothetical protein
MNSKNWSSGPDARGRLKPAPVVKPFFAVSSARATHHLELHDRLRARLGSLEEPGEVYRFSDYSSYYDDELGGPVWKYLVGAGELAPADRIVGLKLMAEELQESYARRRSDGTFARTVNIDPGYINGWQVVLATVKNHSHRIYLAGGIFGEVTLIFREGRFEPLPWTYPDYRSDPVLAYLTELRSIYRRQLAEKSIGSARRRSGC